MEPILSFLEVFKSFPTAESPALNGVSFRIHPGDFAAFAGPSGSGKTTALNLAAGLDAPSRGRIQLLGKDLGALNRDEITRLRRDSVGFVFQSYNLFPVLTALENIEYPLALKGIGSAQRRNRAMAMLEEVGLSGLGNRRPVQLSGGQ